MLLRALCTVHESLTRIRKCFGAVGSSCLGRQVMHVGVHKGEIQALSARDLRKIQWDPTRGSCTAGTLTDTFILIRALTVCGKNALVLQTPGTVATTITTLQVKSRAPR